MLALSPFLGKVGSKGRVPMADVLGSVVERIAQIPGASFLHVGVAVFELPGLVSRGRHSGISQQFVWRIKAGKVADLGENHGAHTVSDPRDGGNGRMQIAHDGLNSSLNFFDLSIQFPDETDGVLQFQGLRSAAFEKRIKAVVAYDVMDNGFEVMTHIFPSVICKIIREAYAHKNAKVVNGLVNKIRRKSILADWAFSQGMYITGTATPYDFYVNISKHTLNGITPQITQDVLLLAGEKDHYIPSQQFYRLKKNLPNVHSLTCRMFTESEGGEQHCQIGNHLIAINYIIDWLDKYFKAGSKR